MRSPQFRLSSALHRALSPFVPARKMLPFTYFRYRVTGLLEPELMHLDALLVSREIAIDIGANEGMYTYALAKRFARVYSFEINAEVTGLLENYKSEKIELVRCGLSSASGEARFFVPVSGGLVQTGWGSLDPGNLPEAERVIETRVPLKTLDEFKIGGVGFIKIDVEGHEVEVLKGAAETIANSRPVILMELKKHFVSWADGWFAALDYKHVRLEDLTGKQGSEQNHIFLPVECLAGRHSRARNRVPR